ncbi:MAG: hypothetical protein QM724_13805 [Flavobacteriales bacterium]
MAESLFTITFFASIRFAPDDMATVMIAGSSSGAIPTASASAKRMDASTGLWNATFRSRIPMASAIVDLHQEVAELPDAELERGRSDGADAVLQAAEHGVLASEHHHGLRGTADHAAALPQAVRPLRDRCRGIHHARLLAHGERFARERGFVHVQFVRLDQPQVRRNDRAGLEDDDVTGYDRVRWSVHGSAVAQHGTGEPHQGAQRFHRAAGIAFLPEAERAGGEQDGFR